MHEADLLHQSDHYCSSKSVYLPNSSLISCFPFSVKFSNRYFSTFCNSSRNCALSLNPFQADVEHRQHHQSYLHKSMDLDLLGQASAICHIFKSKSFYICIYANVSCFFFRKRFFTSAANDYISTRKANSSTGIGITLCN